MIGQWEKLFTPSTPFLMTPSSGESIGLAALRIMQVFQAKRSSTFVWCHLQFIRSAVHLEADFAFTSFSNPPFLQFIRSANALLPLR